MRHPAALSAFLGVFSSTNSCGGASCLAVSLSEVAQIAGFVA
jgi:hypothetical protein